MDISQLVEIHNDLAKRVKQYEQHTGELPPLEVLNEMRYGFRAVMELLEYRDQVGVAPDVEANLMERIKHALLCAYHDLVDGIVVETVRTVESLTVVYPDSYHIVDRLVDIYHTANQVEEKIVESRGQPKERGTIYGVEIYDKWFVELADGLAFIRKTAVRLIVQHDAKLRERRRRQALWTAIGIAVGLAGTILTAVG